MTHWSVVLFLSLFLFIFGTAILAFAISIGITLVKEFTEIRSVMNFLSWLLATAIFGGFAFIFGRGAYLLSSDIVNGLIGRFLT